jgi:hypothetical protein
LGVTAAPFGRKRKAAVENLSLCAQPQGSAAVPSFVRKNNVIYPSFSVSPFSVSER